MKLASPTHKRHRADSPDSRARLVSHRRIQTYCAAVARRFRPQKIVLFGSYAYGQPTPDSDVDLLVILPFRGNDVAKAIQIRSRFDTPFPMDLLVRKPEFIATRLRERDLFIEQVMNWFEITSCYPWVEREKYRVGFGEILPPLQGKFMFGLPARGIARFASLNPGLISVALSGQSIYRPVNTPPPQYFSPSRRTAALRPRRPRRTARAVAVG